MPEVEIEIGGRQFTVACQDGRGALSCSAAAKMLDTEATVILGQIGRMPPDRMLLMAGLMLADKTAALEDDLKTLAGPDRGAGQDAGLGRGTAGRPRAPDRANCRMPGRAPNCPTRFTDGLAELAARAEAMAEELDKRRA